MSQISSINFKKSNAIQTRHNDRDLPPNYLISDTGCEVNRTHKDALKLKNQIIQNAKEAYMQNCKARNKKFQATSYEWSAVCNIKEDTTMQDLERLAEHFEDKYGFQCYQIAIHRDEGHIDDNGNKAINHHAHLEFITLDKHTGKNMYRRELISPKILRQIQTEVAEILGMKRGLDKRLSNVERVEPRKYAQMKEQERKEQAKLKAEHKKKLEAKDQTIQKLIQNQDQAIQELIQDQDQTIQELIQNQDQEIQELKKINQRTIKIAKECIQELEAELEQEKLSKAELKAELEELRKNSKNQGYSKEYFREISKEKKLLRFKTLDEFNEWVEELRKKHTKKGLLGNKVNEEEVMKDIYKVYQEQDNTIQAQNAKIKDLEAEKEQFNELLKTNPALKEAYNQALKILKNKNKPKTKGEIWNEAKKRQEAILEQSNKKSSVEILNIDKIQNADKTEVKEQDQEQNQEQKKRSNTKL